MIEPLGTMSKPIHALRRMISESQTFMEWVDADDPEDALERIHIIATDIGPKMPFCLIDIGDWSRERYTMTNNRPFQQGAGNTLLLSFRAEAEATDELDAGTVFLNYIGLIIEDIEKMAGIQSLRNLPITEINMIIAPTRIESTERVAAGDYYEAAFALTWTNQP